MSDFCRIFVRLLPDYVFMCQIVSAKFPTLMFIKLFIVYVLRISPFVWIEK